MLFYVCIHGRLMAGATTVRHRLSLRAFLILVPPLFAACSVFAPPGGTPGMSRVDLIAQMGQPERVRSLDGGSLLEFPGGPFGKQTWFIYLDASGNVIRSEQVLTEKNFDRIEAGMTRDEVRNILGRPGEVQMLGRGRGVVWSYRYENNLCNWFQVEISRQQQVRSAGNGLAPECEGPNDRADK